MYLNKKEFILNPLNINNNYNILEIKKEELMNRLKTGLIEMDLKIEKSERI